MTPSALIRNLAALIEEVVDAKYDRASGDQQPITAQEWDMLNDRWRMLYVMNRPRGEANGNGVSASTDGFPY